MDFIADLKQLLTTELQRNAISKQAAEKVSDAVTIKIHSYYSGQPVYVKKKTHDKSLRNAEIYARFDGKNARQICGEFDLCYQHVRKIIGKERKKRMVK